MNGLWQILIRSDSNPPFVKNDIVQVFYEATDSKFVVTKNDALLTTGPTLNDPSYTRYWRDSPPETIVDYHYSVSNINDDGEVDFSRPDIQYCENTTLVRFEFSRAFPYAAKVYDYNSVSCSVSSVCDIAFTAPPEVTRPSAWGVADGEISVTAISSNGDVKYALSYQTYPEMTNTTGKFTDLLPGSYTIYARDAHGCLASVSTQLLSQNNHSVRWRLEYSDANSNATRIDILQLDYTGDIEEVCGTDTPFILRLRGENKNLFDPVFSTECSVNLLSATNYQFLDLFTQDEREYLVRYYKNLGTISEGSPEQPISTNPITFPDLSLWGNGGFGVGWSISTSPSVTVVFSDFNSSTGYSKLLNTTYDFIEGYTYDITVVYNINEVIGSIRSRTYLQVSNDAFTVQFSKTENLPGDVAGQQSISLQFTANSSCSRILFKVSGLNETSITVNSVSGTETTVYVPAEEPAPLGYELKWSGFISPGLYTEEYWSDSNYYVSANATDQLTLLNDLDFTDSHGNIYTGDLNLIKIISLILSKTDLLLPIHIACDIYENNHTEELDPLYQTYVNVETTFVKDGEPLKCIEVLSEILKPFGARIYQWDNAWKIECIYQKTDTFNYRIFDRNGKYVSTESFDPIVNFKVGMESDRAAWINRSSNLEIVQAAGTTSAVYQLKAKEFGFRNGGFEQFTLQTGYPGWTLFINGNNASINRIGIDGNDSEFRLKFVSQSNNATYTEDAYVLSENVPMIFSAADAIKFSFDFRAEEAPVGALHAKYLKFKYSLTLHGYYLQDDGTWSTDPDFQWIEVIVPESRFNDWQTIEIHTLCPPVTDQVTSTYNLRLMHGSAFGTCWIFTSITDVKALPTVKLPAGYIALYAEETDANTTTYRWYKLTVDNSAEDLPDVMRPNDYNSSTNRVIWKMDQELISRSTINRNTPAVQPKRVFVNSFDNATMEFWPDAKEAPEEKVYSSKNSRKYKNKIETPVILGDAPVDITNAKNIYDNYLKRSTGDPTYGWSRTGFNEFQPLLSLLAKQNLEQYRKPRFKLTGSFICDHYIGFNACLKDGNRYYLPMGMEIDDKRTQYTVELHEAERVNSDTVNPFGPAEFNTQEFGADYDI